METPRFAGLLLTAFAALTALPVAWTLHAAGSFARAGDFPRTLELSIPLSRADYERLLEQPFDVPDGTRRVEVSYRVTGATERTVVDLGLRGPGGFRGWSGGGRQAVWVSALGATAGYLPGAIEPGSWAVLLGVPNIREGRHDTVTITVRLFASDLPDGPRIGRRGPGWFAGDLHAHSGHSDGRTRSRAGAAVGTPPGRVFDAAVAAGLDFLALTDHNTTSHWLDVERLQPYYDDLLLLHARELTTYRGHVNTIGERTFHEFRLPAPDASPAALLAPIAADGAFVSINHPRLPDGEACMGCGWNVADAAVLAHVHGVEVVNGDTVQGPLSGWAFWAAQRSAGHRLVAVGGSDDHSADDPADRRIGRPATVVWARELSEAALVDGLRSGRVYVRTRGPQGPSLELHAESSGTHVEMGGTIRGAGPVRFTATLRGADGQTLEWIVDGDVAARAPIAGAPLRFERTFTSAAWVSLVVRDPSGPTLFANAIQIEPRR